MATKTQTTKPKKNSAKPQISTSTTAKTRRVKPPKHKFWRRPDKRFRPVPVKLPSSWSITKHAFQLLAQHWKLVGGIVIVYGVLDLLLVHGLNGGMDVSTLKQDVSQVFHGGWGHITGSLTVFGILLTSSGSTASDASGAYQTFLILIVSLALVWSFRQLLAAPKHKLRIRDGFYQGMYPLIPVILVLIVIALQLIPAIIGGTLYGIVVQNGIAVTGMEQLLWLVIFLVLAAISIYMLCSSLFALYIATLPNITPMKALRSARGLAKYRRWSIIRKLLFLLLILFIGSAGIMLPLILFVAVVAQWVFFALTTVVIAIIHAYMYTLYRSLLDEQTAS